MGTVLSEHVQQFREKGFFILEKVLDPAMLTHLRDFSSKEIERMHEKMDREGTDVLGINHRNRRYFIPHSFRQHAKNYAFIFGDLMEDICRATLGDTAWFFLDQYVIKAAQKGVHFSWHQDSGYIEFDHEPYITCWTALDEVTEQNGTVYMLPYPEIGIRSRVRHILDPQFNDRVGYFGDKPGIPVIVPAGSVAVFSSVCFHRSGANTTSEMRRVLLTQYSKAPIVNPWTGERVLEGIPFLRDGNRVDIGFEAARILPEPVFKG